MKKPSPFQNKSPEGGREAAVKLIRERIKALYGAEKEISERPKSELVDRFWQQHKYSDNPQAEWQRFYAGLSDDDKHLLWNEYHDTTAPKRSAKPKRQLTPTPTTPVSLTNQTEHAQSFEEPKREKVKKIGKKLKDKESLKASKQKLIENVKDVPKRRKKNQPLNKKRSKGHWKPFIISLSAMAIWLLAQYNPLLIAMAKQYVSPGDTLRGPVIIDPNADIEVGEDPRIIIPKINVDVPVVYSLTTRDEKQIQDALEDGVVHYAGTGVPGTAGNNVIVGHSSNNFLNSGKYKFAFVLLDRLDINDTFILHYEGTRYIYKIVNKETVEPNDFSLTLPTTKPTTTLITCTPPGTSWRRLIIQAEQISPAVTADQLDVTNLPDSGVPSSEDSIVPGNAPSLFQRFRDWL